MIKKTIFFCFFSFLIISCSNNDEDANAAVVIKLDGNLSDGKVELSWTIDNEINGAEYEIFSKINGTYERIEVTEYKSHTVDLLSIGTNYFYIQYNVDGKYINISNVLSFVVEDIESNKTYFSDINALYNLKKENINSDLVWEFDFDDFGRPIDLKTNGGGRVGFSTVDGKKRVTWLNLSSVDSDTKITSLAALKDLTVLTDLLCINNQLKQIDVKNNKMLKTLICTSNQLSSLNIDENILLEFLECSSNQLSSLNIDKNRTLNQLYCSSNQLTSLDGSTNINLRELDCNNNPLTPKSVNVLNTFIDNSQSTNSYKEYYLFPNKESSIYNVVYHP